MLDTPKKTEPLLIALKAVPVEVRQSHGLAVVVGPGEFGGDITDAKSLDRISDCDEAGSGRGQRR